jgi:hypothetical protein
MGVLLASCPTTGKEFSTGVNVDRDSLVGLRAIVATSICPHCGAEHASRVQDARYVDAVTARSVFGPDRVEDRKSLSRSASSNESRNS